ncbi:peroxiredoxin [Hansschlegelia quercus]|uniref:peroxiredoxin n=1 Tax=Hansschlegelia quercus TaxID=2528245 RepID=UPI0013EF286E|nr:peroxiredoxin [Hansschlegelia quercus]
MPTLPTEGQPAPDFTLPGAGGRTLSLADFRGRKVVLYFYPKDDTSGCTLEAQEFTRLKEAFDAAGASVIGVSPDSVASHDKFAKKYSLDVALASDETKEMLTAYGVWGEKSMYGRKYLGVERATVLIDGDGKVARVWTKVKARGHADEVFAAVQRI